MSEWKHVVVAACGRSAVGKAGKKGALRAADPIDFAGRVLMGVLDRLPQLDRSLIEDVIVGCALPEGKQGLNPGKLIAARAGLPDCVPGMTVNRFCSSGIQSAAIAAAMIESGMADVAAAGGFESMSAIPMTIDRSGDWSEWIVAHAPEQYIGNGVTAENVAAKYGISREEMDTFALRSHQRAAAAQAAGKFDREIIPLPGLDPDGSAITFEKDEGIRPGTTMEKLGSLKPCFMENGSVTAATSSQVSDGAGFLVLMSDRKAEELGIRPLAYFRGFAVAGCSAAYMGLGPIYAVPKVMEKTGLRIEDMDVIELNEAFASQAIACIRDLKLDPAKVNPNGGAIALGHPLGATGAILTCKALDELERTGGKYALITMCIAGGMGAAGIFEAI